METIEIISPAEEMKLLIIENFIDYFFSDEKERELAKQVAFDYVAQDDVNELSQVLSTKRK
jgi:hypothetical protein